MANHRLLFSKTGRARYISHLDLMRTFQRAFFRAGIPIKHTEGFNPHAFVSIVLPLSVGFSSECEILEFGLLEGVDQAEVPARMNAALPEGIVIHSCYEAKRPVKALTHLDYVITFDYETGVPYGAETALKEMLGRESHVVKKKSKKAKTGYTEVDIAALVKSWNVDARRDTIEINVVAAAQNPGLNPDLIRGAFCEEFPQFQPDFVSFHRKQVLDAEGNVFR